MPISLISIPFAYLGGSLIVEKELFLLILGWALLFSGILMSLRKKEVIITSKSAESLFFISFSLIVSGGIGFVSGIVGIGGGIFFAPLLHLCKVLPTKNIAAFCSMFIFLNSLSGLFGQISKYENFNLIFINEPYLWLFLTVLIGGQIGSHLSINFIRPIIIRRLTSILVIYISLRILLTDI